MGETKGKMTDTFRNFRIEARQYHPHCRNPVEKFRPSRRVAFGLNSEKNPSEDRPRKNLDRTGLT